MSVVRRIPVPVATPEGVLPLRGRVIDVGIDAVVVVVVLRGVDDYPVVLQVGVLDPVQGGSEIGVGVPDHVDGDCRAGVEGRTDLCEVGGVQ